MTSVMIERLASPTSARGVRARESEWRRAVDAIAERAVWCLTALDGGRTVVRRARSLDLATRERELGPALEGIAAVARDDVVVLHDPFAVGVAEAIRERGAHALLRPSAPATALPPADAYLVEWSPARIAAVIPAVRLIDAKQLDSASRSLAWNCLLADIVRSDREETVGGVFHPRPTIGAR
jgi:hypothetical protein